MWFHEAGNGTCTRNVCISSDRACDIAVAVHLKRTAFRVRFCPLRLARIVLIQHSCSNNCKDDVRTGAMVMNH